MNGNTNSTHASTKDTDILDEIVVTGVSWLVVGMFIYATYRLFK